MISWENNLFDLKHQDHIDRLNAIFRSMSPEERIKAMYSNKSLMEKNVILTSSFGTTAVYLLHLYFKMNIKQEVYFLDTSFHFDETLMYKHKLTQMFDLNVKELFPEDWKNKFTRENEVWKTDPDLCCSVNKVEPMLQIKQKADIWVSGLMSWQNDHRQNLDIFQWKEGTLKFYPIIDVKEDEVKNYLAKWSLPVHPLKPLGYESIGCKHCTFKGRGRAGRWSGNAKTECGLHQ